MIKAGQMKWRGDGKEQCRGDMCADFYQIFALHFNTAEGHSCQLKQGIKNSVCLSHYFMFSEELPAQHSLYGAAAINFLPSFVGAACARERMGMTVLPGVCGPRWKKETPTKNEI